jgi:hypothetical protein
MGQYSRSIHRRPRARAPEQDIEGDGRSDRKSCQTACTWIHCRAVDHEYEKESQNSFHQNSLGGGEINRKLRSASNDDIAPEQTEANQSGGDCETVSKGDSDDVVPGSFGCANPDEDERECSDEFSEQRAKLRNAIRSVSS